MQILVTGATGFLGSTVVRLCSGAGHRVIGTVHRSGVVSSEDWRPLDVTDPRSVEAAIAGADVVVHTAYTREGSDSSAVNVDGTANVARSCAAADAYLIHVSSDVVFSGQPLRPNGYREDDPVDPVAGFTYGMEKAAAEGFVRAAGTPATIVRTTLMYDRMGNSSLEAAIVASAAPDSTMAHFHDEYRSPVHVEDVATAIVTLLELAVDSRPEIIHLGGPDRMSRSEIARALAPDLGIDPALLSEAPSSSIPGNRPADLTLDSSLAGDLLGYEPRPLARTA